MARRGQTHADILIGLTQSAELFHAPDGTGFADLSINSHRETWPVRTKVFRRWLARRFFEETRGAPSSEALQSTLNVIEARAHFDAPERAVYVRVGGRDDRLYLDLSDDSWRAVEIDSKGWRVIENPPVRFRRSAGMKALPTPLTGGSVRVLRSFRTSTLYRPRRGIVRRLSTGDPERHRGHCDAARLGRPRLVPDVRADPRGATSNGGGTLGGI